MILSLLGMEPQVVDGPAMRIASTLRSEMIPRATFERAKADAVSSIGTNQRLPAEVWIGSERLSIGDFAATLAGYDGTSASVGIHRANLEFENYFSTDPKCLQLADPPGGFQRAGVARSRPAAGLDAQAGTPPFNQAAGRRMSTDNNRL
jgi:hypothetical protein